MMIRSVAIWHVHDRSLRNLVRSSRRGRPNNTLSRESEEHLKMMNSYWEQLERIAHDRVGWTVLVGG